VYIEKALLTLPTEERLVEASRVSLIFGFVTMMSGIIGIPLGMYLSTKLKVRVVCIAHKWSLVLSTSGN